MQGQLSKGKSAEWNPVEEKKKLGKMTPEQLKEQNFHLKKIQIMLLNELRNIQRDRYANRKRATVAEKRYNLISEFLTGTLTKVRMQKEAVGLKARLDALNEISGENMRRCGVDRAILNGKV